MTRRRVIFVGPSPSGGALRHPGGQLTAARGIADYAKRHGYDLDVCDTSASSFPPPPLPAKFRQSLKRLFSFVRKLSAGDAYGVILFVGARHSFFERVFLSAIARACGVRTLFCIRDGAFVGWMRSTQLNARVVAALLRIPHRIVVQGFGVKEALTDAGVPAESFVIVRNWLPTTFEPAARPRRKVPGAPLRMLFVGWLVEEKGVWELIDAFVELRSRHQVRLDLVGGGTLEVAVRKKVADSGLADVHIHGWLSAADVRGLLDRADIFVLPTHFEGFPNALLEAMACGLPAVCSDVGAIADSVHQGVNGFLVPPRDPTALVAAVERYLGDPSLIPKHSAAALSNARELHDRDANLAILFSCFQ